MEQYNVTLKEVTDMFESCGCYVDVTTPALSSVVMTIKGPVSMCPPDIFERHVERAKEVMRASHPDVSFHIDVKEAE